MKDIFWGTLIPYGDSKLLSGQDMDDVLSTPKLNLIRLVRGEHDAAMRESVGVRREAERLLADEKTGDYIDALGNDIYIRSGSAPTDADLQIDRWIKTTSGNRLVGVEFQVFRFFPGITILDSHPKDYNVYVRDEPATTRPSSRREANQNDLRRLAFVLRTSTPQVR